MKIQHKILVCSTCASVWQDGKRVSVSGGQKLLEELTQQSQNWSHSSEFTIESVECMSACSHACVIAFTASGKFTYLFGNLERDTDNLSATSAAVLDCASLYCQKPDGIMPWSERSEPLKRGIIARIPSSL
jgi:predicted metal-binding protein